MALTDWVFPEMGNTCEETKRVLKSKKQIALVQAGATDNRSRVAEKLHFLINDFSAIFLCCQ